MLSRYYPGPANMFLTDICAHSTSGDSSHSRVHSFQHYLVPARLLMGLPRNIQVQDMPIHLWQRDINLTSRHLLGTARYIIRRHLLGTARYIIRRHQRPLGHGLALYVVREEYVTTKPTKLWRTCVIEIRTWGKK